MQTPLRGEEYWSQVEGREQLKLEARQLMNRIINKALHEWDVEFQSALMEGNLKTLGTGKEDLRRLLQKHSMKELEVGNDN